MGADGNIGSTLNFMPGVYQEIHRLVGQGQLADAHEYQLRANKVTNVLINVGFMGALKTVMTLIGFDCGQPRLPRQPLDTSMVEHLESLLQETDFKTLVRL